MNLGGSHTLWKLRFLCFMFYLQVNDLSVNVRAKAAGLLGSLHAVSARFLEQTLDKKLMSKLRVCRINK